VAAHGASSVSLTWQEFVDDEHTVCGIAWQNPGLLHEAHFHEPPEMFFILNGAGETFVGDRWTPLLPGDLVFNGSNVVHQTRAAIDFPLLCFYIFPKGPFNTFKYHFLNKPAPDMPAPSNRLPIVHSFIGDVDRRKEIQHALLERPVLPNSICCAFQTPSSASAENSHWKYGLRKLSLDSTAEFQEIVMRPYEVWYILSGSAEMVVIGADDKLQNESPLKTNNLSVCQTNALYNSSDHAAVLRLVSGNIIYVYFWAKSS
jgi:mannose-6-phosphate isomerase-like protein (cupin superfamily)